MYDTPLGSNPPNTFRFSYNQITFKIRFVGTEVPVPIVANCVPPYQARKCAPLYLQTKFEAIRLLLLKVMVGLNPVGYWTLRYLHRASARPENV